MKDFRYIKNGILEDEEQEMLSQKKVAVIGCGGLGGYIIEMLARLGVGHLVLCDGDSFDESNLNRQLYSLETNQGSNKALEAAKRILDVNCHVRMTVFDENLTEKNARSIIEGCDLVVDALDSPKTKVLLEEYCEGEQIPMVHGAISGWFGQVCSIFPGEKTLAKFYDGKLDEIDADGNPAFTPALVASLEVSEALKILLGKGEITSGKMSLIDLYFNEIKTVEV